MLERGRLFAWRHRSADPGGGKERGARRRMAPGAGPGDRFNNNPPNQEHSHGKDLGGACPYLSEFSMLHKAENRRGPSFVPRPSVACSPSCLFVWW
jgi:hypothetical protein